jgi:hypothetical protein
MNKTGRLHTHCKLHITMHSPFNSDHGHKFKSHGLLVSLFALISFLSAYTYHNDAPNQGTKDETMTNNYSHNLNGGTMYDLWVMK